MQEAVSAGLAALAILVLLDWAVGAVVVLVTPASIKKIAFAGVLAFAVYSLTLAGPLARALQTYCRSRAQRLASPNSLRSGLPLGLPPLYWLFEFGTLAVVLTVILIALWARGIQAATVTLVLLPLCVALPPVLRSAIGRQLYGHRLLKATTGIPAPIRLSSLQKWLDDTANRLGLGEFAIRVLPLRATFILPLRRWSHLIIFDEQLFAVLDDPERRAIIAHEIAHSERNDVVKRALIIAGLTVWYLGLFGWMAVRTPVRSQETTFVFILLLVYGLNFARRALRHRAEYAADRLPDLLRAMPRSGDTVASRCTRPKGCGEVVLGRHGLAVHPQPEDVIARARRRGKNVTALPRELRCTRQSVRVHHVFRIPRGIIRGIRPDGAQPERSDVASNRRSAFALIVTYHLVEPSFHH